LPRKSTSFWVAGEINLMEYIGNRKAKKESMAGIGIEDLVALTDGTESPIRVRTKSNGSKSHGVRTAKARWKSL